MARRGFWLARRMAALLACLPVVSACSLLAPWDMETVTVTASEPDAELYADGTYIGKGTGFADVETNRRHDFTALLGDRKATARTEPALSTTGALDAIGGFVFLLPWIGLVTPGAWHVNRTSILLVLPPDRRGDTGN